MNLVQFALTGGQFQPWRSGVISVALISILSWQQMPKDIFPRVGNSHHLMFAQTLRRYGIRAQMEGYLTYYYEYHFLYVAGNRAYRIQIGFKGAAIIKLQFHPGTDMSQAMAENRGIRECRGRAFMPTGNIASLHYAI